MKKIIFQKFVEKLRLDLSEDVRQNINQTDRFKRDRFISNLMYVTRADQSYQFELWVLEKFSNFKKLLEDLELEKNHSTSNSTVAMEPEPSQCK